MENLSLMLLAVNPATGTQLPLPLFIISGVVVVGCVAAAIITKVLKNKKSGSGKKRK